MWHADSGQCMGVFAGHADAITTGGFTPDGKQVYTASDDMSLRVWNPKTAGCSLVMQGQPMQFHR